MADEREEKELLAVEETEEESSETGDSEGEQGQSAPKIPDGKTIRHPSKGSKKWIILSVSLLVLIISGLTVKFFPNLLNMGEEKELLIRPIDINNDNLSEELLSPFFIPPSNKSSRGAIRIDFSVIWDNLASLRFNKKELKIRSDLSKFITDFANSTDDLNENISYLEQEMGVFFRNALGARDLVIKIKEIRYL